MANLIQIKRSATTATPTSLANGELAYTSNGDILYIGAPDGSNTVTAISGKRYPGTLTANQALVANTTSGIDKIIVSNAVITSIWADGSAGSSGQVLVSNGTAVYWGTGTTGSNTQIQFNDSGVANASANFTFDKDTSTLYVANTITVGTATVNSTIYSGTANNATNFGGNSLATVQGWITGNSATSYTNATSYADTAAGTAYSNAMSDYQTNSGTFTALNTFQGGSNFEANVALGDTNADRVTFNAQVNSNVNPSANVTYSLGTNDLRWNEIHASNVHSVTGYFDGDVSVSGDLVVSGNVTYVAASELSVSDPLIHLASNNETSDTVDIGFVGHYSPDAGVTKKHAGFYRDASDDSWYLFTGSEQAGLDTGTTTVDSGATGYTQALIHAYLNSGSLIANSTVTNITANSTVSVAIVANTLSLSTALAGTSGGTGKATMTAEAILVGNSTNGYKELTLGTSGYVLQSNGTALIYDTLDGGSF